MRACIECKKTPEEFYTVDIGIICLKCFTNNDLGKLKDDKTKPTFIKKVCTVHKCSSYNPNLMARHEMPWCDIVAIETVGITKPKTKYDESLGGLNGNISRHYYKDWTTYCQQKDKMIHAEKKWEIYRKLNGRPQRRKKRYAYN